MLFPSSAKAMPPHRVVITGAGIVTALGIGWQANARGFRAGRTAFRPVTLFDVSRQRVKTAAAVDLPEVIPQAKLSKSALARLDRAAQMLLLAAGEAWRQSGWVSGGQLPVILGTTSGGMSLGEDYFRQALHQPHRHRRQATRALIYQAQSQGRIVEEAFELGGPVTVIANACASGANALGHAWEMVRRGRATQALAGGYDALSQLVFAGFDSLQALSPTQCRPFDARRDGLSLGEGAAILALETLDHARRRGAQVLGELMGYGTTIDLHHLTQPHPQGEAALASMNAACAVAGIAPEAVDYLNAHGTGTPLNDHAEAEAVNRWAGRHAGRQRVSSTKASIGHTLGAAGAIEAVVCLMALREQWLPPETTLDNPDPVCAFQLVREPTDAPLRVALSNSFGFGGSNATLIFRRWA